MSTESDNIRAAVAALLATNGVTFTAAHRGEHVKDKTKDNPQGWTCDAWNVAFVGGERGTREDFDYYTGTGLRKEPPFHMRPRPPYRPGTVAHAEYVKTWKPVAPRPADVLHSLVLDSSAVGQSFESWASDFGYDPDSRKAEATYRACQQNADKLARVLGHPLIAELSALLQDY
jgi:hypothetical protein